MKTKFSLLFSAILFTIAAVAQFEGKIEFNKISGKDTSKYIYYVKGDNIRIDNLGAKGEVLGTSLVDLKDNSKYVAISPNRKMYMDVSPKKSIKDYSTTELKKTNETKSLYGFTCTKWLATNKDFGTTATYWMTEGFDFFSPMLHIVKRKENLGQYLMTSELIKGWCPLMSEERDRNGNLIEKIETISISKETIADSMFTIPKGFQKFEN